MDFPLRSIAATHSKEVMQTSCVHRYNHFGFAGVGQKESCIFVCKLRSHSFSILFGSTIFHKHFCVDNFKTLNFLKIVFGISIHRFDKCCFCLRVIFNDRRNHIPKIIETNISLTLNAETGNSMPRDLSKKRSGYTFNTEGEISVFGRALMSHGIKLLQKRIGFFGGQTVHNGVNMGIGIT